eukprot:CAMPEP_0170168394 /NCGR_PEP_ID=MMETSP0040_2-20121228/1451_1 /TAXON_ID=641309 /ORGANISM="Lotharella oceanica, Strain CCMP622" /LENGTH=302 /DNA_ID=CAMNT_0010406633 /DNA_START=59 /DNA_END=967 /DNA_ORIENTATION=+
MAQSTAAAVATPSLEECKQYVRVTVSHGEEHGLLDIEENDCVKSLHEKILARFPELKSEDFAVKYKDDEEDWITVVTTSDLQEALEFLRETNNLDGVPDSAKYRESRVSQGGLQLIINVVEKQFQSSVTVASTPLVAADESLDEPDMNQVISAYKRGAVKRDSVEGILSSAVEEIPPAVYNRCPISRLFKYMVESLVQTTQGKQVKAIQGPSHRKLEDDQPNGMHLTPSPHSLREATPSPRPSLQDEADLKRIETYTQGMDVATTESMDVATAERMLRRTGFRDERKILGAERGNVETLIDR